MGSLRRLILVFVKWCSVFVIGANIKLLIYHPAIGDNKRESEMKLYLYGSIQSEILCVVYVLRYGECVRCFYITLCDTF